MRAALVVVECYLADNKARKRPKPKRFEAGKVFAWQLLVRELFSPDDG